jgi:DNA-binding YbaB/EbfC family protein
MVNINQLMKQAQEMQKNMQKMQDKLALDEFSGISGGNTVHIILNGKGELKKIKIDPEIANKDDVEMLEDLIIAAYNDAKRKVDEASEGGMAGMLGGMKLPPGMKMPF